MAETRSGYNLRFRRFCDSYHEIGLTLHENTRDLEIFLHKLDLCQSCFLGVFTVSPVRRWKFLEFCLPVWFCNRISFLLRIVCTMSVQYSSTF